MHALARVLSCAYCGSSPARLIALLLEAARASVASVVSELAEVLPKLGSCRGSAVFLRSEGLCGKLLVQCAVDCNASAGEVHPGSLPNKRGQMHTQAPALPDNCPAMWTARTESMLLLWPLC